MRTDDVLWIDRSSELGFRGVLLRTKTSGVGRRVKELPIFRQQIGFFDWWRLVEDGLGLVPRGVEELPWGAVPMSAEARWKWLHAAVLGRDLVGKLDEVDLGEATSTQEGRWLLGAGGW